LVLSTNIEELNHLKMDIFAEAPRCAVITNSLLDTMNELLVSAKEDVMYSIMQENPVMFKLYEHILFARLLVVQQIHVLKGLEEEGGISEDDLDHFLKNMTDPSLRVISSYIPSVGQLSRGGHSADLGRNYSGALDTFVALINRVTFAPVN
jgi:hypothetical protein